MIRKIAYIRQEDSKWVVYSESGKKLGEHDTKEDAEDQLQAIHISQHSSFISDLVKMANFLDDSGFYQMASEIDDITERMTESAGDEDAELEITPKNLGAFIYEMIMKREGEMVTSELAMDRANNIAQILMGYKITEGI